MALEILCDKEEMDRILNDPELKKQYDLAMGRAMYRVMYEDLKEEIDKYKKIPMLNMSERK
jgi:hypothetical protein